MFLSRSTPRGKRIDPTDIFLSIRHKVYYEKKLEFYLDSNLHADDEYITACITITFSRCWVCINATYKV